MDFAKNRKVSRRHCAKLRPEVLLLFQIPQPCVWPAAYPTTPLVNMPMSLIDNNNPTAPGLPTDAIAIGKIALVAASAAMGGFLFGFDTAVINGAVDAIRVWSHAASWLLGFAVAGALLGSALRAWFAGPFADRYGRIAVMEIAAAIFFLSSIGTGLAWNIEALSLFRFLGGTAIGAASVIAPAYIAEVSPAAYRGRLGSLQQLAIVTGIFVG